MLVITKLRNIEFSFGIFFTCNLLKRDRVATPGLSNIHSLIIEVLAHEIFLFI